MTRFFFSLTLPLFTLGSSLTARAMETDNFTDRNAAARDALPALDRFTSDLLDRALTDANAAPTFPKLPFVPSPTCSRPRLMSALKKHLGATPVGQVEKWARSTPDLDRLQAANITDIDHDIYRGIPLWQYPLMKGGIDPSVRAAGIVVGVDKFGHFLAEGLHYYEQSRSRIENAHPGSTSALMNSMSWGELTEDTYFGLGVSGVRSYADLSANLAGYHFWSSITEGAQPYFACQSGTWRRVRDFTWADYLSDAWDEGINCSTYSPSVAPIVARNQRALGMTCPVAGSEDRCAELARVPFASRVTSPVCLKIAAQRD